MEKYLANPSVSQYLPRLYTTIYAWEHLLNPVASLQMA